MPRLRRLSGAAVIAILRRFGFGVHARRGSHVKVQRVLSDGTAQSVTIPDHPELDAGTCRAIVRQAGRFVREEDLRPHFDTE